MTDPIVRLLVGDLVWLALVLVGFGFVMALFMLPTILTIYGRTWREFVERVLLSWVVGGGAWTLSFLLLIVGGRFLDWAVGHALRTTYVSQPLFAFTGFVIGCWCVFCYLHRPDFKLEPVDEPNSRRKRFVYSLRTFLLIQFAVLAACGLWAAYRRQELKDAFNRREKELQPLERVRE